MSLIKKWWLEISFLHLFRSNKIQTLPFLHFKSVNLSDDSRYYFWCLTYIFKHAYPTQAKAGQSICKEQLFAYWQPCYKLYEPLMKSKLLYLYISKQHKNELIRRWCHDWKQDTSEPPSDIYFQTTTVMTCWHETQDNVH